ncbi:hypothetical protein BDR04DRAFT_1098175 [Suillus decipiens]|nr:hypothetical protein BDR04DRAFT_1098175 [Suillus decipiens]
MDGIALRLFFLFTLFCTFVRAKYRNITVDSTDPSIQFFGNWNPAGVGGCDGVAEAAAFYGATHNCTTETDTSALFTFTGVAIYYINALIAGNVTTVVSRDFGPRILVDLSSPIPGIDVSWAVRWGETGLNNSVHTLTIYGPSNNATPSGTWGEVNALMYTVVEPDDNIGAIVGGVIAGLVILAATHHIFGQKLEDWFKYLGYLICGWLLFKGRRLSFISNVPYMTQITLLLTREPRVPSTNQPHSYLCWKVFDIGPAKCQEVVKLPSKSDKKDEPGLVFCTLNDTRNVFTANLISLGGASEYRHSGDSYEWFQHATGELSVVNNASHEEVFALATPSEEGADPFWTFTLPKNGSREFAGEIFVHAFETTGATAGSRQGFSTEFLTRRITKKEGYKVSELVPTTYWYVSQQNSGRLEIEIRNSRKGNYKWPRHRARVAENARNDSGA